MLKLYEHKPEGEPIYVPLRMNGVYCYSYSDHAAIANRTWWMKNGFISTKPPFQELQEPWFLLYHTFNLHGPENPMKFYRGDLRLRKELHEKYNLKVERVFRDKIIPLVNLLNPKNWAVMGDHGEEFFDETEGELTVGHGSFDKPIETDNVKFTGLFTNSNHQVHNYKQLHNMIEDWYGVENPRYNCNL